MEHNEIYCIVFAYLSLIDRFLFVAIRGCSLLFRGYFVAINGPWLFFVAILAIRGYLVANRGYFVAIMIKIIAVAIFQRGYFHFSYQSRET